MRRVARRRPRSTASTISQSQLQAQLTHGVGQHGGPVRRCSIEEAQSGGTLPPVAGTGDDTVSTQFAASQLERARAQTLEENELRPAPPIGDRGRRRHGAPGLREPARGGLDPGHLPVRPHRSRPRRQAAQAFLDQQASSLAAQEKLEEVVGHVDVSPAAVRAYYSSHQSAGHPAVPEPDRRHQPEPRRRPSTTRSRRVPPSPRPHRGPASTPTARPAGQGPLCRIPPTS